MEAGRNFEKPSRLGLLFFSNSFFAHRLSRDPSCAARARPRPSLSEYRRRKKGKSRFVGHLRVVFPVSGGSPPPFSGASSLPWRAGAPGAASALETGSAHG